MVNSTHPQYIDNLTKWKRSRTVLGGEDFVKAAGEIYLPKLTEQEQSEYDAYKMRAMFFNATGRTVDSFVGMVFRKPSAETVPDKLQPFLQDATLSGQSWEDYEKAILREVIGIGRIGSLVEWSDEEKRPFVCRYEAEQILNWKQTRFNGKTVLSLVVLEECVSAEEAQKLLAEGVEAPQIQKPKDEFEHAKVKQIRVLKLEPLENIQVYKTEIWQASNSDKETFKLIKSDYPLRKGKKMEFIPFVFHGPNNVCPDVDRSPVEDIVSVNLSHYRSSADLEHGRHFTGLPTAYAAGFDPKNKYKIGSGVAWVSNEPQARAAYLEFSGQGLQSLEKALEQKERLMAVLGARMLEQEKRGVETEAVLAMKQTGEQASLSQIAQTCSEAFEMVLRFAYWWEGAADAELDSESEVISVELNRDFNPTSMPPQLITAIVAAVQAGLLSEDSAVTAFKRGELVSELRNVAEEMDLIRTQSPKLNGDAKAL